MLKFIKNSAIAFIFFLALGLIFAPFSFNSEKINFSQADTEINYQTISSDTVWGLSGSPYIISTNYLYVSAGATLTIEPGVIIKLSQDNIIVNGTLNVQGGQGNPVIFTSINDDSDGGKSVAWSSGNPQAGDWGSIKISEGGSVILNNVDISYGGSACVYEVRANIVKTQIANAGWCYDVGVISSNQGLLEIDNSKISNNGIGLQIYGNAQITNSVITKNNIGLEVGGGQVTVSNSEIYGNQQGGIINYWTDQVNAANNWWGDNSGPNNSSLNPNGQGNSVSDNVIFDPWVGKQTKPERNPVIIIPGFFGSWGPEGHLALDPILHTYDNLWEALQLVGYEKDKTLFAFPYNWRQSNVTSSLLLKQKIAEVKSVCNSANPDGYDCSKVDLVAHSMGGLVARAYAESNGYQDDIDQLIFLATPQKGSPMAYLSWEGGESGIKLKDTVLEKILLSEADENGYLSTFSYIRNLPMTSVQELLPTFNYLRDNGSDNLRAYPYDNYPRNLFLENLNNSYNLAKLQNIKILNIVADSGSNGTMSAFRVVSEDYPDGRWENGYPENYGRLFTDRGIEYGEGDDTVPAISNKDFNNFNQSIFHGSNHLKVVSDAQGAVVEELTGISPSQEVNKNFIQKIFMARIFSPADFMITAPDGKRIGKDFATGQNINEIDGAYYSGKFATIPDPLDGEYKIELQGTGNGEYELSISGIDEVTSTDKDFTGQITTGAIQDFKIDYSSSSSNLLEDLHPQDITPPNLFINSPLEGAGYKHNEKIVISYDVSDDFSGLANVVLKIDNTTISSTTVNLFDYQIGTHTLSIVALDNAGNSTEKNVDFRITADIKSTIADIEEVYSRGWLKGLSRKNILIGELKILDGALNLIDKAKTETIKKIEDAKNNSKLSAKAKERLIASLNSVLAGLDENRQKVISLNFGIFEKTLNEFKKLNYLNQAGYDIIKSDLEYLKDIL